MAIADIRRDYNLAGLHRGDLDAASIFRVRQWFDQALGARTSGCVRGRQINLYKSLLGLNTPGRINVNAATLANKAS